MFLIQCSHPSQCCWFARKSNHGGKKSSLKAVVWISTSVKGVWDDVGDECQCVEGNSIG